MAKKKRGAKAEAQLVPKVIRALAASCVPPDYVEELTFDLNAYAQELLAAGHSPADVESRVRSMAGAKAEVPPEEAMAQQAPSGAVPVQPVGTLVGANDEARESADPIPQRSRAEEVGGGSHAIGVARDTDGSPVAEVDERPRNWGDPYKEIFSSAAKGFELGEDRWFKQRVFRFRERPEQAVIDILKDSGFTYRPSEKAWTVPATPETRRLSDELAREFAGGKPSRTR